MSTTARRSTKERNAEIVRELNREAQEKRELETLRENSPEAAYKQSVKKAVDKAMGTIEKADAFSLVEATLLVLNRAVSVEDGLLERARNQVIGNRSLEIANELASQDVVTTDDLGRGLAELETAMKFGTPYEGIEKAALELKGKVGEALLDEKLEASRATLDSLIENMDLPVPPVFIDSLADQHRSAVEAYRESVGGNDQASKLFFEELERELSGRQSQRSINAMYRQWLRDKALENDPTLRDTIEASERLGAAIIDHAKEVASITPRHAVQLVGSRTKSGTGIRGVVSRAGWKPKQFDADMVELMSVAGKAIPRDANITVGSKGDIEKAAGVRFSGYRGRSFHSEGPETGAGRVKRTYVCLSGEVSKRTLYHEIGHAIEAVNPVANAMVSRWLKRRIEGKDAQRLSSLTGIRSYKRSEVAVKDDFIDPYVGKVYTPRQGVQSNEVLAMGLERLADPMSAAKLAIKDPDHLALILAALQLEYQP